MSWTHGHSLENITMVLVWNINLMTLGGTEMKAQPAEDESSNWGKVIGDTADRNANVSFLGNENSRSTTCARGDKTEVIILRRCQWGNWA